MVSFVIKQLVSVSIMSQPVPVPLPQPASAPISPSPLLPHPFPPVVTEELTLAMLWLPFILLSVSRLPFPKCRFPIAVSQLRFPDCRFPIAVSHLTFVRLFSSHRFFFPAMRELFFRNARSVFWRFSLQLALKLHYH